MTSAAIMSDNLAMGTAGGPYSLWVGGDDVIFNKRTPIETIEVTENGPGAVSSMAFTVEDPTAAVTIGNGIEVLYFSHTTGLPIFRGWIQQITTTVFGVGRSYRITCTGAEAVLDWMLIPSLTIPAGTYVCATLVQQMVAAATGVGVALNVNADLDDPEGSQAQPVGSGGPGFDLITLADALVFEGTSLREAIRQLVMDADFTPPTGVLHKETVDFWLGLRFVWVPEIGNPGCPTKPADYADMTLTATPAGTTPGGQHHELDGGGVVRGVHIKGGNAAGTGTHTDGSGIPGQFAFINDDTILTAAGRRGVADAYLRDNSEAARGSVRKETFTPADSVSTHVQVMSDITITDAQIGLSAQTYEIMSIHKVFHGGGRETWTIGYGGLPPSLPRAIRRLTRDVRS